MFSGKNSSLLNTNVNMKKAKLFIIFAMLSLVVNAQDEVGYDKLNVK